MNDSQKKRSEIDKLTITAVAEFSKQIPEPLTTMGKMYKKAALHRVSMSCYHFYQVDALKDMLQESDSNGDRRLNHVDIHSKISALVKKYITKTIPITEEQTNQHIRAIQQYELYRTHFTSKANSNIRKDWSLAKPLIFGFYKCVRRLDITNPHAINLTTSFKEFLDTGILKFDFQIKGHEYERTRTYLKTMKAYYDANPEGPVYAFEDIFNDYKEFLKPKRT